MIGKNAIFSGIEAVAAGLVSFAVVTGVGIEDPALIVAMTSGLGATFKAILPY